MKAGNNKKNILHFLILAMLIFVLTGCGNEKYIEDERLHVVCTIFPAYDWAREIIGDSDNVKLSLLVDNGVDLHSYQPTADDIITIADCDLFVYVGGESDTWVSDVIEESGNKDMKLVNMMELLGDAVKEEEIVEGMQEEHGHDHEDNHDSDDESDHHADEAEYDEHVWLSLTNAEICSVAFTEKLSELDFENSELYEDNCKNYIEKLRQLDKEYKDSISTAKYDTVLFGDRFPFLYLVKDYDINYYAAYVGCSAETEADFETIKFLAEKIDEIGLPVILVTESADKSLAKTILESSNNSDRDILVLDSMQAVTKEDVENGITYLSVMESNLKVLEEALGCNE